MKLEQLMEGVPFALVQGSLETEVTDIIYDSRKAAEGMAFVCIVGTQRDSHDFAADCAAKGVSVLVIQHDIDLSAMPDVTVVKVENSRYAMALMSCNLFGNPSRQMTMIGVTGTKGKTTTTHMIKSVLEAAGKKVGMIGTNGIYFMGRHQETANTTPESYELQKTFRQFVDAGCDVALMEVSSQGLMMDRVAGIHYNVGVFTKYISDGSYQMIADMMTEGKADLVGISELDSCTVRTGRVFQLKKFAGLMGKEWSYEYSRAMAYQGGAYGDGIASREKPVRTFAAPLPKGDGAEPRVMVVMEFEKYVFATTHLDHVSALAQAGQVDEINKVIEREFGGSKKPVFLGGDFNVRPDSPTISKLKTGWTVLTPHGASDFTHSSQAPNKCIDYILLWNGNGAKCNVVGTKIMLDFNKGDIKRASDHIPVLVDVKF